MLAAASAFHEIFYHKLPENFFAELFRKSTAIFPEISGKIPREISGNFRTHNPTEYFDMYFKYYHSQVF